MNKKQQRELKERWEKIRECWINKGTVRAKNSTDGKYHNCCIIHVFPEEGKVQVRWIFDETKTNKIPIKRLNLDRIGDKNLNTKLALSIKRAVLLRGNGPDELNITPNLPSPFPGNEWYDGGFKFFIQKGHGLEYCINTLGIEPEVIELSSESLGRERVTGGKK